MEKDKKAKAPTPKINKRKEWINKRKRFIKGFFQKLKISRDISSLGVFISLVFLDGFVVSTALVFFNIPFTMLNIASLGCLVWFTERRLFPMLRRNFIRDKNK